MVQLMEKPPGELISILIEVRMRDGSVLKQTAFDQSSTAPEKSFYFDIQNRLHAVAECTIKARDGAVLWHFQVPEGARFHYKRRVFREYGVKSGEQVSVQRHYKIGWLDATERGVVKEFRGT